MCYPCTHCNKCGAFPTEFTCRACGSVQELGSPVCTNCGAPLPLPAGMPIKAPDRSGPHAQHTARDRDAKRP